MDLGNLVETIVHHLEVRGMAGLDHWDRVPIVSALVCTVTHWIIPMVTYDISLSINHILSLCQS